MWTIGSQATHDAISALTNDFHISTASYQGL